MLPPCHDPFRLVERKQPGAPADTADLEFYDYRTDPETTREDSLELTGNRVVLPLPGERDRVVQYGNGSSQTAG